MPSRRTHTKSRHGCIECKGRKVKCDETRPQCLRCKNRQSSCHYSEPFRSKNLQTSTSSTSSSDSRVQTPVNPDSSCLLQPTSSNQNASHLAANALQDVLHHQLPLHIASSFDNTEPGGLRRRDMELLHHYTISTAMTLYTSEAHLSLWQISIPKMSFSNDFLLHGILALSACHFAYTLPKGADKTEYENLAKHHYTISLALFAPLLSNLDVDNMIPIFCFSMLVIVLSMAMPSVPVVETTTELGYIHYMVNTLRLVRGVKEVLAQTWPMVRESILQPLLQLDPECKAAPPGFEAEVVLRCIEARIHSDIGAASLREEYLEAVKSLRDCSPGKNAGREQQGVIMAWPAIIPPRFFEEMNSTSPIVLAILTFFGTLLHRLDDSWWATGKGKRLVEATTKELPRGWENVVVWGRMNVGLPCDFIPR